MADPIDPQFSQSWLQAKLDNIFAGTVVDVATEPKQAYTVIETTAKILEVFSFEAMTAAEIETALYDAIETHKNEDG